MRDIWVNYIPGVPVVSDFTATKGLGANLCVNTAAGTLYYLAAGDIPTAFGGSGTVTSVSVATANGVSGSVATATTTPAITLTLGAITPASVAAVGLVSGSNLSGTNTGDQTITLTGDVTGSGAGSFAATIANDAVTFAKMQNASAASKLLGRGSAAGAGDFEELTLGSGLTLTGTNLSASGGSAEVFIYLNADYTLTSTTSAQKLFNTTANGRLTISETGLYLFEASIFITNMSASNGNGIFYFSDGGTATLAGQLMTSVGHEPSAVPTAVQAKSGAVIQASSAFVTSTVTPATNTNFSADLRGIFKVTATGTIRPCFSLSTAAAAVVKAGSWYRVTKLAADGIYHQGGWD